MKKSKLTVVYNNSIADRLIAKEVPVITKKVTTYSHDLANKQLPKLNDSLNLYLPFILTMFQSLLAQVHKIIGAQRLDSELKAIHENYKKEEQTLNSIITTVKEELRLLKKRVKELQQNLGHLIRSWRIALFFLGFLSLAEVLLNHKIFLGISGNNGGAFLSAISIGIAFFIINHVFPDILNFFSERRTKILVGISIVGMVTASLYNFAKMRLSHISNLETVSTEHISEWSFVAINLVLFLAGTALTIIYKPSKKVVADYSLFKQTSKQIKAKQKEFTDAENRLAILTKEKNERLAELEGVELMAMNYERTLEASYQEHVALWRNENLIMRKPSDETPKCFLEQPTSLTMYFQKEQPSRSHSENPQKTKNQDKNSTQKKKKKKSKNKKKKKKNTSLLTLFVLVMLMSCTKQTLPKNDVISVLIDCTDTTPEFPTAKALFSNIPKRELADGLELSIIPIANTHYTAAQRFVLEKGATGFWGNDDLRTKQYRFLQKSVKDSLGVLQSRKFIYKKSDIFRSVVQELNYLAQKPSNHHRELWVFSDMKEHSFFSIYDKKQQNLLVKNPQEVAKIFQQQVQLPEVANGTITLRICHTPSTPEEAKIFSAMLTLYKIVLNPKGISVVIGMKNQIRIK